MSAKIGRKVRPKAQTREHAGPADQVKAWNFARWLWIPAALLMVVIVVYLPAIRGDYVWDDDAYVVSNETLRSIDGLRSIWFKIGATPQYYPLVFTTFWAEYHLWGLSPTGYHLVNVLMHAASAILVWRILLKLEVPGAALAAFIFALHPVHVESVAWITERKNVLSGLTYLGAMLAFFHFQSPGVAHQERLKWKWYWLSVAVFAAALLSKTVTATLPAALVLIYWWKEGRLRLRHALPLLPMLVIGVCAGLVTAWVEKHHVGTKYLGWDLSFVDRILIAGHAVWFYLAKLVWPAQLTFIYPRWEINSRDFWQYLYPLTAVALLGLLWAMRRQWGRGPLVGALFFGGTLFPALGFIDVFPMRFSFVADHFQYLCSLGPIVLISSVAARRLSRPIPLLPIAAAVVIFLGGLSYRQSRIYHNRETLWRDTLAKNPRASIAHINLGAIYQQDGRFDEADRCYQVALNDPACLDKADVLRNLGLVADARGETAQAVRWYEAAIEEKPSFANALVNLGEILRSMGKLSEAGVYFERAVAADPNDPVARNNLGSAKCDTGRLEEAVLHLRAALKLRPNLAEAHYNLAIALSRQKKTEDALAEYRAAIKFRPDHVGAHINSASLLQQEGRFDEAMSHLRAALRIDPNHPLAHFGMGLSLDRLGQEAEAAKHYAIAQRLRPDLQRPTKSKTP